MRLNRAPLAQKFKLAILPAALVAGLAFPGGANALSTGYQSAGSLVSFSKTGNGTTTFTPAITFPGFNPASVPTSHVSPQLYGFRYFIQNVTLGGTLGVAAFSPTPFTATPAVSLKLDSIVPTGTPVEFTLTANTISGTAVGFPTYPISNTTTSAFSPDLALPPPPGQFTVPNNVAVDYFTTAWSVNTTPTTLFTTLDLATINGQFGLQYVYTYVPGPLPILGAGAAFGWTRRLRRRISKSA
jgi:hypothetical protein